MKFATSAVICLLIVGFQSTSAAKSPIEFLREAAVNNGLVNPTELNEIFDSKLADIGETIFKSKSFSLNGNISCQNCHLEKFGSADGIPNAIGIGGTGEGASRILKGGAVLPRNTLPLWGRGWSKFKTFFWDGRVDFSAGKRISQFGASAPSDDPLLIAIHLPVVEIREMLAEDKFISANKKEDIAAAGNVYSAVIENMIGKHDKEMTQLAQLRNKKLSQISFPDLAVAVKHFFRRKFALKPYKFSEFVFKEGDLSDIETRGGLLFYGKAKCAVCHSGPILSDFNFHVIPFYQLGAGKNGFGIDYGRFNVTHNPNDLYRFRTPPLLNVSKTAPYGHSGGAPSLAHAITSHFDPLHNVNIKKIDLLARSELYKKISRSSEVLSLVPALKPKEVESIVAFLKTLEF